MELLAILLSGLLGGLSPVGLIVDQATENALRARFRQVDQLEVRVDNPPSHQLLAGKLERLRIAGRGLELSPDVRLSVLELETDPLDVDLQSLRQGTPKLRKAFQGGLRVVMSQADLNRVLQSPGVSQQLRNIAINLVRVPQAQRRRYELKNSQVELLENNRLRLTTTLQEQGLPDQLPIVVETGLTVVNGRSLQLIDPIVQINGNPAPPLVVMGLTQGIAGGFDLRNFQERMGITARLLQLQITPGQQISLAAFVRAEPQAVAALLERRSRPK